MRDLARDLVRGTTVAEMEVVNHLNVLAHAPISAGVMTYADTIMPMFTFISGMGTPSVGASCRLVGLGLVYNVIKSPSLDQFRPFGVLQRLGLSHLVLSAAPSAASLMGFTFPVALCSSWIALSVGLAKDRRNPFNPPANSAQTRIDRWVCSLNDRLTMYREDYDPEGLLGVLTTTISMWFGRWCVANHLSVEEAIITGISLSSFGYMFSYAYKRTCPLSKPFWSLSFMFSSSGISLLKYTIFKLAMPYLPHQLTQLLISMGQRSLECFFASAILDRLGFHEHITGLFDRFGKNVSQAVSSGLSTCLLAGLSVLLVKYKVRL